MIKQILAKIFSTILMASLSFPAFALVPIPYGWYLEGNVGMSRIANASYATPSKIDNNGWAINLNAGYKFIPFFGAEIGYTNYGTTQAKTNGTLVAQASPYAYDFALKAIFPFADTGIDVFGKVGAARIKSQVKIKNAPYVAENGISVSTGSSSASGLYYGFGVDYAFLPNVLGVLQWERANGNSNTGNLELYSVGVNYLFG